MKKDKPKVPTSLDGVGSDHVTIGTKLRLRRKVKGLGLQEVAARAGISTSQLSQVERGLSPPSLRSLRQICAALNMPMGWLFEGTADKQSTDGVTVHATHRRTLDLGDRGMIKQLLTPDTCSSIQMMMVIVKPGGSSGKDYYHAKGTAECGTVLKGTLGLDIDGEQFVVPAGDTFAFEGQHEVRFWCIGEEVCEVMWTATPALY